MELVLAVALAGAWRLGTLHYSLEPACHVHVQHLVTPDETVFLGQTHSAGQRLGACDTHVVVCKSLNTWLNHVCEEVHILYREHA